MLDRRNVRLNRKSVSDHTKTLTFDIWPWKWIQQYPLIKQVFVPSFVEIRPLSEEIPHHSEEMLMDGRIMP